MDTIFERVSAPVDTIEKEVRSFTTFEQIEALFKRLFDFSSQEPDTEHQDENCDYGLKIRGKAAREKINAACREILSRVNSPEGLTPEERETLIQYSGRGGLTENSQYEYCTPAFVAEGVWDSVTQNDMCL